MTVTELQKLLRPVEEDDRRKLPTVSYSKLDVLKKCVMQYAQKYKLGKYSNQQTLALELGTILHKGLEMKGRMKIDGKKVDYLEITDAVTNGCQEITDKGSEQMIGLERISQKYFEDWFNTKEGEASYTEKTNLYLSKVIYDRMEDEDWKVIAVEKRFEFVYDNRVIIHGFIDRVDQNKDGELRVVDYKSSKKVFRDEDIKTPLQMVTYDIACVFLYGKLPVEHEYDFILLDQKQGHNEGVCSKGYFNRGIKNLNSLLDKMDSVEKMDEYEPSPTPLCYWCAYPDKTHTPNADSKYAGSCPYYSLWKPEKKSFQVNEEFVPGKKVENKTEKPKRTLVF